MPIKRHFNHLMNRIDMLSSRDAIIVFVSEGRAFVGSNNRDIYTVHSGEMFLLPANQDYFFEVRDDNSYVISTVFDLKSYQNEYFSIKELQPYYKPESDPAILKIKQRLKQYLLLLDGYLSDGHLSRELMEIKKQEFVCHLFVYYSPEEVAALLNPFLDKDLNFKEFVSNNFRKSKNVIELAKMANYSTSGFIKRFKRTFNCSPQNWMIAQRASIVLKELSSGKTIKEVAIDNGFSSYEHFCRFCKRHLGATPAEIRTGKKGEKTEARYYRLDRQG
jgi:AraC-type DNA-binding domain-containing proteins